MARVDDIQEAIHSFMSSTGVFESVASQKLKEHRGNINVAVNVHFSGMDQSITQQSSVAAPQDDVMDMFDPLPAEMQEPPSPSFPFATLSPLSLLNPDFTRRAIHSATGIASQLPKIEDTTETERGMVIMNDDEDDDGISSAPAFMVVLDYGNGVDEQMMRAAIEASMKEFANSKQHSNLGLKEPSHRQGHSHLEDTELVRAVSFTLQIAERQKVLRELEEKVEASELIRQRKKEASELESRKPVAPDKMWELSSSNGRQSKLDVGSSSSSGEDEDVEELPLFRPRRRHASSASGPQKHDNAPHSQHNASDFPSDEWGGISSEEYDGALLLKAAIFALSYPLPHPNNGPSHDEAVMLENDEFLEALQADKEKKLKALEEAALAEKRLKEEELCRQLKDKQEVERQLAAKEVSIPQEPTPDDENAVKLLVGMPDGSKIVRRFLKSDKLQCLFDFIDVGRVVKSGSYRLVWLFPRRSFSDRHNSSTLRELGLTGKQEALYLELL